MSVKKRFISLLDEIALQPQAQAQSFTEHTSGGERDNAPRGAFQPKDEDRIEEILTGALRRAEKLLGRSWDGSRHTAEPRQPHDENAWNETILTKYVGVRNRMVASEEDVPYYVIRDLRKKNGLNGYGHPLTQAT